MLLALAIGPAFPQTGARAIGAVIAPPELIAKYTCVDFAGTVLPPTVIEHAKARIQSAPDKSKALGRLLSGYGELSVAMCGEVHTVFQRNRENVLSAYTAQLPQKTADINDFLADPGAREWSTENAVFLRKTAMLIELHALATQVAPEFFNRSVVDPHHAPDRIEPKTLSEVTATSVGMSAENERLRLILLVRDKAFAQFVPAGFNLDALSRDEQRLRKESSRLYRHTVRLV